MTNRLRNCLDRIAGNERNDPQRVVSQLRRDDLWAPKTAIGRSMCQWRRGSAVRLWPPKVWRWPPPMQQRSAPMSYSPRCPAAPRRAAGQRLHQALRQQHAVLIDPGERSRPCVYATPNWLLRGFHATLGDCGRAATFDQNRGRGADADWHRSTRMPCTLQHTVVGFPQRRRQAVVDDVKNSGGWLNTQSPRRWNGGDRSNPDRR